MFKNNAKEGASSMNPIPRRYQCLRCTITYLGSRMMVKICPMCGHTKYRPEIKQVVFE